MKISAKPSRINSLDILRGLAIFGMGVSAMVPNKGLPAWLYHAQEPPPTRVFDQTVFGITWVDLVFPFFLFSMGAAIPVALQSRIDAGESKKSLILGIISRGLMLCMYALIGEHFRPYTIEQVPSFPTLLVGLVGFFLISTMFIRLPKRSLDSVPTKWREIVDTRIQIIGKNISILEIVKICAFGLSLFIISFISYQDGRKGFSNDRNDIILMVLGNVSISGALIWIYTQNRLQWRIGIAAVVGIIFLTSSVPGVGKFIWDFTPLQFFYKNHWPHWFDLKGWKYYHYFPIIYHFEYHKYLLIVLPGTIAGDLFLRTTKKDPNVIQMPRNWLKRNSIAVMLITTVTSFVATVGLLNREVIPTFCILLVLGLICLSLTKSPGSKVEILVRELIELGVIFTLLGVLAEPIGGGIRKDSPTLSYFILTSGLAFQSLAGLTIISQTLGLKLKLLSDTGQNPILGYLAITNIVPAVFGLTFLEGWVISLNLDPWVGVAYAFLKGIFFLVFTAFLTRQKIFLRA